MVGFARHVSAALVVIAMIAAQVMPAWAGCHSQHHKAAFGLADTVSAVSGNDGKTKAMTETWFVSDQSQLAPQDICLGNCGCACGISSAFVLSSVIAIDAPRGVVGKLEFVSSALPLGDRPDGPRRPPRIIA